MKLDLPHIVCRRCSFAIDTRRALSNAIREVGTGRDTHVRIPGLRLIGEDEPERPSPDEQADLQENAEKAESQTDGSDSH